MNAAPAFLRAAALTALCALAGCATYAPLPLDERPALADSLDALAHPDGPIPATLTIAEVAYLAVENNPDLRAARARRGVAQAQVLQAGLLPDPQVSTSYSPILAGPGTTAAWSAGLTEDIQSLVTLSARRKSARAAVQQVDADLLWQEWQVIAKARLEAVDLIEGRRMETLLSRARDLLSSRYRRGRAALARGDATVSTVSPDLAALAGLAKQIDDLNRLQQTRRHNLDALLGLSPDVVLPLTGNPDLPPIESAKLLIPGIENRRPDLVALRLGYAAQDAKVRAAILAQFPNLAIGLTGGSDNTNVRTLGPQITLTLPVFDRNQGHIAIERATRKELHDQYTARLAAATGQARALLADVALLKKQLRQLRAQVAETARVARDAEIEYRAGNLDERSYVDLVDARIVRQEEIVALEQSLLGQQVAAATLTGAGMPLITVKAP